MADLWKDKTVYNAKSVSRTPLDSHLNVKDDEKRTNKTHLYEGPRIGVIKTDNMYVLGAIAEKPAF